MLYHTSHTVDSEFDILLFVSSSVQCRTPRTTEESKRDKNPEKQKIAHVDIAAAVLQGCHCLVTGRLLHLIVFQSRNNNSWSKIVGTAVTKQWALASFLCKLALFSFRTCRTENGVPKRCWLLLLLRIKLELHQKTTFRRGRICSTCRLLREPKDIDEFQNYKPEVLAIWRDNLLTCIISSSDKEPTLDDTKQKLYYDAPARDNHPPFDRYFEQ